MLILGHRGVNIRSAPFSENSMAAFECALAEADGFETDACLSKDGEVFLIHAPDDGRGFGRYLDTVSAEKVGKRLFDEFLSQEIAGLRLQKGESIPTLRQVVELVGQKSGKILNIELKSYGVAQPVVTLLQDGLAKNLIKSEAIIVSSFNHAALGYVRKQMPQLKIGALFVEVDEDGKKIFPSRSDSLATYVAFHEKNLQSPFLRDLQPDFLVMPEKKLVQATVDLVDRFYPKTGLCGWTVSERDDVNQADLLQRLRDLPSSKIAAMIVDDPHAFVQAWRNG